eukprot:TRINITY_DN6255_c0_g1_i2.p1 TRINITY_DN6255_c0_g1~~TRINITY_DN6255_c0_g1_i2.p1  ORF type:complete len:314 (+),score=46.51 TRINITY_DN6255_c0_g1_i2:259-1200(+)
MEPALPCSETITSDTWRNYLGLRKEYAGLYQYFLQQIQKNGVPHVLNEYLPQLFEGLCGSAFHALIQLGFAIDIMHEESIAEGLAYWVFSYLSLGKMEQSETEKDLSPLEVISLMKNDRRLDGSYDSTGFQVSMRNISKNYSSIVTDYAQSWRLLFNDKNNTTADNNLLMNNIIEIILKIYVATGTKDFFILHGITSAFAIHRVFPFVQSPKDQNLLLRYFWLALLSTYLARDRPFVDMTLLNDLPSPSCSPFYSSVEWKNVIESIFEDPKTDEHKVKITYVCKYFSDAIFQSNQEFDKILCKLVVSTPSKFF